MSGLGIDGTTYAIMDVILDDAGQTTLTYDGASHYADLGEADAEARRRSEELGRTSVVCRITPVSFFAGRVIKN